MNYSMLDAEIEARIDSAIPMRAALHRAMKVIDIEKNVRRGIPSGYSSIDRLTGGWKKGELIVLGARPSGCKTVLALNMAIAAAIENDMPTLYLSPGESIIQLTLSLISIESGVRRTLIESSRKLNGKEHLSIDGCLANLAKAPLYLEEAHYMSIEQMRYRIEEMVSKRFIKLIILDDLQLLRPYEGDARDSEKIEKNARLLALKRIAYSLGVPIIVLSNIGRRAITRKPALPDLLYYCPLADKLADKILLIDRPNIITESPSMIEPFIVKIAHNRHRRLGSTNLFLDLETLRIKETDETS